MSYVRLKHTLAGIALGALTNSHDALVAKLLLAYARKAGARHDVPAAALTRGTGMGGEEARELLLGTGLFDRPPGGGTVSLAPSYREFLPYLRRQAARTVVAVRLLESPRPPDISGDVERGAALFNAGLFFECHEYLEDVWRETTNADRGFYHGLVQAAAGCYHLEKGNAHGARTLIQKAIAKLQPYAPTHGGIDVAAFLSGLHAVITALDAGPSPHIPDRRALPTMPLVDGPLRAQGIPARRCTPRRLTASPGSDATR